MIKTGLLLFVLMASGAVSAANMLVCTNVENTHIEKNTKLLKTFTALYWKIATPEILSLPQPLQKIGFVVGDFHFNNVGLSYNYASNRAEIQVNDFDDAGQNALIIDFFKYLTYVQKVNKEINPLQLLQSYLDGLQLKRQAPPAEILSLFNRNQLAFTKDYQKYIQNRREEFIAFDKSTLTAEQSASVNQLRELKLLRQLTGLDFTVQVNDSGSSMNEIRYEFIGADANGVIGVIEFKGLKCAASGNPVQQDVLANFEWVKNFYSTHFSTNEISHQFVYLQNNKNYFLVREKKNNPLKKIAIEKLPIAQFQTYSNYYANFLGQIHAPSADAAFIKAVSESSQLLIERAKIISKLFKDKAKD